MSSSAQVFQLSLRDERIQGVPSLLEEMVEHVSLQKQLSFLTAVDLIHRAESFAVELRNLDHLFLRFGRLGMATRMCRYRKVIEALRKVVGETYVSTKKLEGLIDMAQARGVSEAELQMATSLLKI
tara:strand:- start:74 stop:451 length:378 start_codon:yes stop_codon:yes gene_type:complete